VSVFDSARFPVPPSTISDPRLTVREQLVGVSEWAQQIERASDAVRSACDAATERLASREVAAVEVLQDVVQFLDTVRLNLVNGASKLELIAKRIETDVDPKLIAAIKSLHDSVDRESDVVMRDQYRTRITSLEKQLDDLAVVRTRVSSLAQEIRAAVEKIIKQRAFVTKDLELARTTGQGGVVLTELPDVLHQILVTVERQGRGLRECCAALQF
jgi:hypothetical protein